MSDATIRIMCPNLTCRKVLIVPANSRGKTVRCRNCATTIRVPQKRSAPDATLPVEPAPPPAAPDAGKTKAA